MGRKKRVLLVDDQPGILNVLGIQLQLHGYDVLSTRSGAEAVKLARSREPDVILLDIFMPGVSGFEVLQRVREFSGVPVIVFTANPQMAENAMEMGATGSLPKPFNADEVVEKIKLTLGSNTGG